MKRGWIGGKIEKVQLPALYEYQVSCRDFPSGHGPDTCIYYMTIIWTCYPPITEANWMDYQYMQVPT